MSDFAPSLPLGFHEWVPAVQAAALGLLTFVQEDLPAVSAALLAAAGSLPLSTGLLGVFFGIWIGDALLYGLARGVGRPLLHKPWARRFFNPDAVARAERWFAERGTWLLLTSRFVPGTRLPTYLAAGFLRLPFTRFLVVTGTAVAVWTGGIFALAHWAGPKLFRWLQPVNGRGWTMLVLIAVLVVGVRFVGRLGDNKFRRRISASLLRWTKFEFWPAWVFYFPIAIQYLRLAFKYRGLMLPTAANPGMFSGGFVGESKITTLQDLHETSPEFTAQAFLLPAGLECTARMRDLDELLHKNAIEYPFILKPDVGQRGAGVKLIRAREQATQYLERSHAPLLVQRYAEGPHELGVFYYRFPHETRGCIFAITEKLFPTITGDGRRTAEELVWDDPRARFMAGTYLRRLGDRRHEVLSAGECIRLVEAGNHAQGCVFQDGMHLRTEAFERRIDEISQRLRGFFIGRYDLRYGSVDELKAGRGFQIIELNGASSEATSIYDARNSVLEAYQIAFRQWELVFAIGAANRRRGDLPTKPGALWRKWRQTNLLIETYPLAD